MQKPIIISLSRRFVWSVFGALFAIGFVIGVQKAKGEQLELIAELRISDTETKQFRCLLQTINGNQVDYALPSESAVYVNGDCRKIFNDGFED